MRASNSDDPGDMMWERTCLPTEFDLGKSVPEVLKTWAEHTI